MKKCNSLIYRHVFIINKLRFKKLFKVIRYKIYIKCVNNVALRHLAKKSELFRLLRELNSKHRYKYSNNNKIPLVVARRPKLKYVCIGARTSFLRTA